jgi:hypothetical protein
MTCGAPHARLLNPTAPIPIGQIRLHEKFMFSAMGAWTSCSVKFNSITVIGVKLQAQNRDFYGWVTMGGAPYKSSLVVNSAHGRKGQEADWLAWGTATGNLYE